MLFQAGDLVAELEVVDDLLHVGRESVKVGAKIRLQLLAAGTRLEVAQGELRGVVKRLSGGLSQSSVLVDDPPFVERSFHVEHGLLGGLQYCIQSADHGHRENDVAILAAYIQVAQHIVDNAPDEIGDPGELAVFHVKSFSKKVERFLVVAKTTSTVCLRAGVSRPIPSFCTADWPGCNRL
ncbi:MAG: hypothetical protein QW835_07310 [Candidatus Hadarchaeum sp.]